MFKLVCFLVGVGIFMIQTDGLELLDFSSRNNITFNFTYGDKFLELTVTRNNTQILYAHLGLYQEILEKNISACPGIQNCLTFGNDSRLTVREVRNNTFNFKWTTTNTSKHLNDCFDLKKDNISWFGGPQLKEQLWPIENNTFVHFPAVPQGEPNGSIADRYWLNSYGVYFYIDPTSPVFVYQQDSLCFSAQLQPPYLQRNRLVLNYTVGIFDDAKTAHMDAVDNFLHHPQTTPDRNVFKLPVWSTRARYGTTINDTILVNFAKEIKNNGFTGQLKIDDGWESCYGSLEFHKTRFANISSTIKQIRDLGLKVTLWVHPFINSDCKPVVEYGLTNNFFVSNINGTVNTTWWNSALDNTHLIDFTNLEAHEWFISRLSALKKQYGIDGFKFDAGEQSYAPPNATFYGDPEDLPAEYTLQYIHLSGMANFSDVRTGFGTQTLPTLVRMVEKNSTWEYNNGLKSVITSLLQMNTNGYSLVMSDNIGGNSFNNKPPDAELFVRWLQASIFLPAIQFGYVPWDYKNKTEFDVVAISKNVLKIRYQAFDYLMEQIDKYVEDGTPVNPPIWWLDPLDNEALKTGTEFMVGSDLLVAPMIDYATTYRKIYLPEGTWIDGVDKKQHEGNTNIEIIVKIDKMLYFTRKGSNINKILTSGSATVVVSTLVMMLFTSVFVF